MSGADAPNASEPLVPIYYGGPRTTRGPAQIADVVSGRAYIEYPASEAPSLPPCSAPSSSAASSG